MPHYNGERSKLLDSFCAYQSGLNPKNDEDPDHWDMALYVSGYVSLKRLDNVKLRFNAA